MSKFQESLIRTAAMRSRVPREMVPLFDHLINLAKHSHSVKYPKRAGIELRKARRLARSEGVAMEPWVSDVLGSEGIMGAELPSYELPDVISGCAPGWHVSGCGSGAQRSQALRSFGPARSMRSLTAIAGASYAIECAGYEHAHDLLLATAGAMIDGWPAGSEFEVGFFGSIVKAVKGAAKGIGRAASAIARPIAKTASAAAKTLVAGVRKYNPVALAKVAAIKAKALAGDIANSAVFKTLGAFAKKALAPALSVIKATVGPILPYVQSVLSFVPGVGTGISAAIGAAQALADGRSITQAIVAAAKSAIPGGPLAATAFDAAWGLAHGRPIDSVALEALRSRLPGDLAKKAFDTGLALAVAKTAQERKAALGTAAMGALASKVPIPTAALNAARVVQNVARPGISAVQTAQRAIATANAVRAIAKNPAAATALAARAAAARAAAARAVRR